MELRGGHPLSEADSETQVLGTRGSVCLSGPFVYAFNGPLSPLSWALGGVLGTREWRCLQKWGIRGLMGDTLAVTPSEESFTGQALGRGVWGKAGSAQWGAGRLHGGGGVHGGLGNIRRINKSSPGGLEV